MYINKSIKKMIQKIKQKSYFAVLIVMFITCFLACKDGEENVPFSLSTKLLRLTPSEVKNIELTSGSGSFTLTNENESILKMW